MPQIRSLSSAFTFVSRNRNFPTARHHQRSTLSVHFQDSAVNLYVVSIQELWVCSSFNKVYTVRNLNMLTRVNPCGRMWTRVAITLTRLWSNIYEKAICGRVSITRYRLADRIRATLYYIIWCGRWNSSAGAVSTRADFLADQINTYGWCMCGLGKSEQGYDTQQPFIRLTATNKLLRRYVYGNYFMVY